MANDIVSTQNKLLCTRCKHECKDYRYCRIQTRQRCGFQDEQLSMFKRVHQ